jgi:septation ring formation regulator EzrA
MMKKNRAAFFNEPMDYYNTQNPGMYNPNQNLMPANGSMPMPQQGYNMMPVGDDIETRLAKIERQLNRIEHRVSLLEQNGTTYSTDDVDTKINNMYMV